MNLMTIIIKVNMPKSVSLKIIDGLRVIEEAYLTVGQDLDIMLIRTIDKILFKNKIGRLSLKKVEISGKMDPHALSGMILGSVAKALTI